MTSQLIADDVTITRKLWYDHVKSDIYFVIHRFYSWRYSRPVVLESLYSISQEYLIKGSLHTAETPMSEGYTMDSLLINNRRNIYWWYQTVLFILYTPVSKKFVMIATCTPYNLSTDSWEIYTDIKTHWCVVYTISVNGFGVNDKKRTHYSINADEWCVYDYIMVNSL